MALVLRCPVCREKFPWKSKTDMPKSCPCCGERIGHDREDDDVVMPFVSRAKTKSMDQVYRQMEAGSEQRAQIAADMAGVPVSEMSDLKITNLNDRNDAERPAIPVRNAVTEHMDRFKQGGFVGGDGTGYSGSVQTGPFPNAGAKMRTSIQMHHGNISHGSAISDRPANETRSPGYRRRG